ncbi:hypothetical protein ITP53_39465 [Nonomuraea sp. K274]|uniref:Uncharacterized protein n=1 Tax=Nonomuraea cypriaca TaxID=1187855 RepID=A0A931AJJ5_9ACTN|nr:hypothetical protein [Nonomuraea cypriaca]MBF8191673.1 hypothetical protein [Nonomuraea cypriaca]
MTSASIPPRSGRGPLPSTEAPFEESKILAPAGLIATREEKEAMARSGT